MPNRTPTVAITFDDSTRRRVAVFAGDLGDADFFNAYVPLLENPAYDHGADDLVDLSGVTHMGVTSDRLRQLIEAFSVADSLGFTPRVAIVAPTTWLDSGRRELDGDGNRSSLGRGSV